MADPLSFEALASSEHVLSSAENFVLYVLLEAIAGGKGGPGGGSRLPLNLGVVIDRSGSMYDERRLEFVIEAVKFAPTVVGSLDGLTENIAKIVGGVSMWGMARPDSKIRTIDDLRGKVIFAEEVQVLGEPERRHSRGRTRIGDHDAGWRAGALGCPGFSQSRNGNRRGYQAKPD